MKFKAIVFDFEYLKWVSLNHDYPKKYRFMSIISLWKSNWVFQKLELSWQIW